MTSFFSMAAKIYSLVYFSSLKLYFFRYCEVVIGALNLQDVKYFFLSGKFVMLFSVSLIKEPQSS
jgi:hypothetical protein